MEGGLRSERGGRKGRRGREKGAIPPAERE
jgi:hypothetical protein